MKLCNGGADSPCQYFRFVYAMQNPLLVGFVHVVPVEQDDRELSPAALFHDVGQSWVHVFEVGRCCRSSDDGLLDGARDFEFLRDTVYQAGGMLRSDGQWRTLEALQRIVPPIGGGREAKQASLEGEAAPEVDLLPWIDYPAMWEFLKEEEPVKIHRLKKKTSLDAILKKHEETLMDGDEAVLLLAKKRAEIDEGVSEDEWGKFYQWRVQGGRWTGEHKGVAFDCYMAMAIKGSLAANMVEQYKASLKGSGSFSISAYGDYNARVLAKAWCHRHYHFLKLWRAGGCKAGHVFSDADVLAYVEFPELAAIAVGAAGAMADRIRQVRAIRPR